MTPNKPNIIEIIDILCLTYIEQNTMPINEIKQPTMFAKIFLMFYN